MWILHPQSQPTLVWKFLEKKKKKQKTIPESPKKQNLNLLCAGNYLHSFYTVFATIYIAFMSH